MTLTPISSLESGRKKFSWTRRTSCLESGSQRFLGSGPRNDSNTHQLARIGEKKLFMNSRYIVSRKWESNDFALRRPKWPLHPSVRANQREKNFLSTQRTSCLESGNQTFLGSGGPNDSNTDQFARMGEKKVFMSSRYIVSRKWESNVFGLRRPKWLLHPSVCANQREKIFYELDVHHV